MAEDIKGLIEKIQQEGVEAAELKAREIEKLAEQRAAKIIQAAEKEAQMLLENARAQIAKIEQTGAAVLEQTGRDLLLTLHQEINKTLKNIIISELRPALTPEEMGKIVTELVNKIGAKDQVDVVISVKEKDLEKLQKSLFSQLSDKVKQGIRLKPAQDIGAGFTISYDAGKSHFDFSDQALAEYLEIYLKPQLAQMLKGVAQAEKRK
ncbi:MAG: hypothetical protein V1727_03455 [Candidatus Omnitrophota bacterium]